MVIARLHRMVRHGYRPMLGHPAGTGLDGTIALRTRGNAAVLHPDGTVVFDHPVRTLLTIAAADQAAFDTVFPPGAPNRRNLVRRLYEMGVGG